MSRPPNVVPGGGNLLPGDRAKNGNGRRYRGNAVPGDSSGPMPLDRKANVNAKRANNTPGGGSPRPAMDGFRDQGESVRGDGAGRPIRKPSQAYHGDGYGKRSQQA